MSSCSKMKVCHGLPSLLCYMFKWNQSGCDVYHMLWGPK